MRIIEVVEDLSDVYGVADFLKHEDKLVTIYGDDICRYPYAIAVGHLMKEDIIENIPLTYNDDNLAQEYLDEYYNSHKRVSAISDEIIKVIEEEGFKAIKLDVSGTNEELNLKMPFSNKASANLAGIGWLGKNNLITTREYGPRLTWATILTDAPLEDFAGSPMESLCDDCTICVKACPGKAIKDLPNPKESYSPQKCGEFLMNRKDEGHPVACGMCLYICPYGNAKTRRLL